MKRVYEESIFLSHLMMPFLFHILKEELDSINSIVAEGLNLRVETSELEPLFIST
jgi:hypothetical protein